MHDYFFGMKGIWLSVDLDPENQLLLLNPSLSVAEISLTLKICGKSFLACFNALSQDDCLSYCDISTALWDIVSPVLTKCACVQVWL
jgi:hypothetical protein